ncbi:MAG: hypothetical protein J0665_04300 [Deltaproteobacteria bacterium]|nr:hypothetical protein [Deltaproteobacteria bacterium]
MRIENEYKLNPAEEPSPGLTDRESFLALDLIVSMFTFSYQSGDGLQQVLIAYGNSTQHVSKENLKQLKNLSRVLL